MTSRNACLSIKRPEVRPEYEDFKLEFEIAEQCKAMRQKMQPSKSAVSRLESAKGSKH
jgi:hypothetical protein